MFTPLPLLLALVHAASLTNHFMSDHEAGPDLKVSNFDARRFKKYYGSKSAVTPPDRELNNMDSYSEDYPPWTNCDFIEVEPSNEAPDAFDWRDRDVVSPVKTYINGLFTMHMFAAVENVESQYAIKHKEQVALSVQQMLDCDTYLRGELLSWWALLKPAFSFSTMIAAGGLMTESAYPYTGVVAQPCRANSSEVRARVTGCAEYEVHDEHQLQELLYKVGPLVVAIQYDQLSPYKGGIITNCFNQNHDQMFVLLVGYGTEKGTPYWTLKFQNGTHFGEEGYARVQRGRGCLYIGTSVTSAVVH